jgi:hypothetical protein
MWGAVLTVILVVYTFVFILLFISAKVKTTSSVIQDRKHDFGTGILGMDYTYKTPPYPILYYT